MICFDESFNRISNRLQMNIAIRLLDGSLGFDGSSRKTKYQQDIGISLFLKNAATSVRLMNFKKNFAQRLLKDKSNFDGWPKCKLGFPRSVNICY
ncbi:hypothetical protein CEXT_775811 [Caerostris extrusa]|uniref:LAGLIDADG homing endonuclease n=1 Tax=Caerostris extrusa TaxID=172846 RepID=A0AAV4WQS2_CAEEX|nr:hypothetical protein CEXT_775811 [Caerostris extrusa]